MKQISNKTKQAASKMKPNDDSKAEFVSGKKPALEIIENSSLQVNKIWISESLSDQSIKQKVISYAKDRKVPYIFAPNNKLKNLTLNQNHQGIVLSIAPIKYLSPKEVIANISKLTTETKLILVTNEIEDPHNIGAMIRTFVAAGGKGIILTGRHTPGINSTTIKTSAGTLFQAQFARATNCVNVINELKRNDFWVVGTDNSEESESIYKIKFPDRIAIVMGNEHEGLGQLIKKNCDFLAKIPISNNVNSLNVSVAFGITLFEVLRQNN